MDGSIAAPTTAPPEAAAPEAQSAPAPKPQPTEPPKEAYRPAADLPTQQGPEGIRFDFNRGARVITPNRTHGKWRVRLRDLDTGNILFESENQGAFVSSAKRFYVRFAVDIWTLDDQGKATELLTHQYDCRDKSVIIQLPVGTLGDTMGWFPYCVRFAEKHGCNLTIAMSGLIIPLFKAAYPNINLVTHEELADQKLADTAYATYYVGLFFDDKDFIHQPTDFRHVGLHRTAGYILGVDPEEHPPTIALQDSTRPIEGPYVCIAVQSSSGCKMWSNPYGWHEVIAFLKSNGYRVICIDQKPVHGHGLMYTHIPHGAEDQTGDKPLTERARWLKHAAFFVGLSSGLAWLAWASRIPVVMISGFTHPNNEFHSPYRIVNWHACNSCWNDVRERFDHKDFMWCPRHGGTSRQFECMKLITAAQVMQAITRIPGFGPQNKPVTEAASAHHAQEAEAPA